MTWLDPYMCISSPDEFSRLSAVVTSHTAILFITGGHSMLSCVARITTHQPIDWGEISKSFYCIEELCSIDLHYQRDHCSTISIHHEKSETEVRTVTQPIAHCPDFKLIHWSRVMHICISKLIIIGSHNGLSPGRHQAIIWTNAGILLIGPLGTNFSEIAIEIHIFSFKIFFEIVVWKLAAILLQLRSVNTIKSC